MCRYSFIGLLLIINLSITHGQTPTEADLQAIFESDLPDTLKLKKIDSLINTVDYYKSDLSFTYGKKAILLGKKTASPGWVGEIEYVLGVQYCNVNELDSSLVYLNRAVKTYESFNHRKRIADVYGLLRYVFTLKNDFEKALKYAYDALTIFEELGEGAGIGASYNDIAGVLLAMKKYDEALEYALLAIETLKPYEGSSVYTFETANSLDKVATVYGFKGDSLNAIKSINSAIALYEGDPFWQMGFMYTRGLIWKELGNLELALEELFRVREEAIHYEEQIQINDCEQSIGEILFEQGKYEEALALFISLYERFEADFDAAAVDLSKINESLYKTYEALSQPQAALFHYKKYTDLKDRAFNIEADRSMAELRTQYETEKKETQIQQLEEEKTQQRLIIFLGLGLLILTGVFSLFLYRISLERKRNNKLLQQQKVEIEQKSNQNELLLKEIHHRVKNNLQTISSLLFLQSAHIEDESIREAVSEGQHRVEAMALIHQKLYQRENLAAIEMKDYLQNLGQTLMATFGASKEQVVLDIQMPELELNVDSAVPIGLIVNELLTNSLKYAFPEGTAGNIQISLLCVSTDELILTVKDDGIGLTKGEMPKGTAFGSQLVQQLAIQLGGKIEIDSSNGFSTRIAFRNFQIVE